MFKIKNYKIKFICFKWQENKKSYISNFKYKNKYLIRIIKWNNPKKCEKLWFIWLFNCIHFYIEKQKRNKLKKNK
jgi:hypothetical protein